MQKFNFLSNLAYKSGHFFNFCRGKSYFPQIAHIIQRLFFDFYTPLSIVLLELLKKVNPKKRYFIGAI